MKNNSFEIIDLTPENISSFGVCGYKDLKKHKELRNKIEWFKKYHNKGLKIKAVLAGREGIYQGMIEYIPGKLAHRPVNVEGYMFIHCLIVGFRKEHKGRGYASALIDACIDKAKSQKMNGVAVVTRKGSFMADSKIFLKKGFELVDKTKPDFSLLALKFAKKNPTPSFKTSSVNNLDAYKNGLTIIRSPQCPYTEKNVNAILETAEKKFNLKTKLVTLTDAKSAQKTPCAFGTFCIIYNSKIISYHPISKTRFENIITKLIT